MKQRAESLGENVLDYDGCAQLWVRSWDDWLAFYNSKEYAAALSDDCDRFMTLPMTYMSLPIKMFTRMLKVALDEETADVVTWRQIAT
ncbi:hypothetical protein AUP68_08708 [Ilyonectria robusta]